MNFAFKILVVSLSIFHYRTLAAPLPNDAETLPIDAKMKSETTNNPVKVHLNSVVEALPRESSTILEGPAPQNRLDNINQGSTVWPTNFPATGYLPPPADTKKDEIIVEIRINNKS